MSKSGGASRSPSTSTSVRGVRERSGASTRFTGVGWAKLDPRMQRWLGQDGVSDDGKWYRVYHGTKASNMEGIRAKGLTPPVGAMKWYMLTTREDDATGFAMNGPGHRRVSGEGRVIEYRIPVSEATRYLSVGTPGNHYGADYGTYHFLMNPLPGKWIAHVHEG